ncbi:MAG: tyrosine-type recombinase/integrase [Actinobacteria bacterium]|nr:tyrosine-type recombinase/integrase [Actinomycetota bacterium]
MSRRLPSGAKWITLPSGARRVELVLDVGEDPATGQRRQIRRRLKTVEEAIEAQAEILKQAREGSYVSRANLTIEQACADWLAGRRLRKGTLANYANSLKPLRRTYGAQTLQSLTKKQINELISRLQAGEVPRADGRGSRPWKPPTVNLMLRVLSLLLDDAKGQGLITRNVVELVDRVPQTKTKRPTYTAAEVRTLLATASADRLEQAWHLALSGLRRGEVCGLAWTDIDLIAETLTVRESRVSVDGDVVIEEPKTEAGKRTLPLTAELVVVLKRAKRRQAAERLKAGARYQPSGYVVTDELGRAPHPETISDYWDRLTANAAVPRIRLHDARHTCGTLMHLQGVPTAVIAAWLGHANAAFTMQTYVHSQEPALRDAARILGALTQS